MVVLRQGSKNGCSLVSLSMNQSHCFWDKTSPPGRKLQFVSSVDAGETLLTSLRASYPGYLAGSLRLH